jgi:hypothetical protein
VAPVRGGRVNIDVRDFPLLSLFPDAIKIADGKWKALCPVHAEKNPSCYINTHPKHGWRWHCFSCGGDGNAIDVLVKRDRMTFREAVSHTRGDEQVARPMPIRPKTSILVCDGCRNETLEIERRTYGGGSRVSWESTIELEMACATGWELSANLDFAIGPRCLQGGVGTEPRANEYA